MFARETHKTNENKKIIVGFAFFSVFSVFRGQVFFNFLFPIMSIFLSA